MLMSIRELLCLHIQREAREQDKFWYVMTFTQVKVRDYCMLMVFGCVSVCKFHTHRLTQWTRTTSGTIQTSGTLKDTSVTQKFHKDIKSIKWRVGV